MSAVHQRASCLRKNWKTTAAAATAAKGKRSNRKQITVRSLGVKYHQRAGAGAAAVKLQKTSQSHSDKCFILML